MNFGGGTPPTEALRSNAQCSMLEYLKRLTCSIENLYGSSRVKFLLTLLA